MHSPNLFSEAALSTPIHAEHFLSKYKPLFKWRKCEHILEAGCSNGRITTNVLYPFIKDHLNNLLAIDIDEPAIQIARRNNVISNLSFQIFDILDTEECMKHTEKFDHVFAFYLFHLLHNTDLWSKNIATMIKPNGQLFTSIVQRQNLFSECMDAQKQDKSKPWSKYIENCPDQFYNYGPKPIETIRSILMNVGFVIDAIDSEAVTFEFNDMKTAKDFFLGANCILKFIPQELQPLYIDDYMERMVKFLQYENGIYQVQMTVVSLLATKT